MIKLFAAAVAILRCLLLRRCFRDFDIIFLRQYEMAPYMLLLTLAFDFEARHAASLCVLQPFTRQRRVTESDYFRHTLPFRYIIYFV